MYSKYEVKVVKMHTGFIKFFVPFLIALSGSIAVSEEASAPTYVVKDGEVGLTYDELAILTNGWTPQMVTSALDDRGDRIELLNLALANKKLALAAEDLVVEYPEFAQEFAAGLRAYQRRFLLGKRQKMIVVPDFTALAEEEYLLKRERIAVNPEKRLSSHILFASQPGLPRDEIIVKAKGVLEELRAGADFEEMVRRYSDEPNAVAKNGLYNYWMQFGDKQVSPPYSKALFEIDQVGGYSDVAQTQFGVHIIRFDGIKEKTYKPFEELKPQLIDKMEAEYRSLTMKAYLAQFNMSDDAFIDDEAVTAILTLEK
jgi:peptidyl-prolyl cis-trans isomerase C